MKAIVSILFCLSFPCVMARAGNPVPFISNPLVPTSVAPGSGALTLTVNGGGFVSGATVNRNGQALVTAFVSNTKLTAAIPASDTANAGSAEITVTNPGVGVRSNMRQFLVAAPATNVYYNATPNSPFGDGYWSPSGLFDFTGNGRLDLWISVLVPQYSALVLGNGDGTFGSPVYSFIPGWNVYFVGDFNGDGKLDVIASPEVGPPSAQIFWGNGDGTFTAGPTVPIPSGFVPVGTTSSNGFPVATTCDYNGDGKLDLLIEDAKTGIIQVLWGNGDGTFSPGPTTSLPSGFSPVGCWDFNGDGKPDLLLASGFAVSYSSALDVLLGNGDGTFTPAPGSPINVGPASLLGIAVGDFTGDGKLDVAVPNGQYGIIAPIGQNTPPLAILLGNGDGTFTRVPNCCGTPGEEGFNAVAGDFNNDGKLDLAVSIVCNDLITFDLPSRTYPPLYVETFLGNGDGTFTPTDYSIILPDNVAGLSGPVGFYGGDLTGNGKLDLIVGDEYDYGDDNYGISSLLQTPPPAQLPDFTIAPASASATVKAGASVTDNINIASVGGFISSGVSLALTGCPPDATCSVTQPQGVIIATAYASVPLTIATAACSTSGAAAGRQAPAPPSPMSRLPLMLWLALTAFAAAEYARRRLRGMRSSPVLFLLPLAVAFAIGGCGAAQPPRPRQPPPCVGGTPAGIYAVTVTATSGSITHSTAITLAVQ